MEKDIEYLKKRLELSQRENDQLKKENKIIKNELQMCKQTIQNIVEKKQEQKNNMSMTKSTLLNLQTEEEIRIVLDFQSKRIKYLEQELQTLQVKYEKQLFSNNGNVNNNDPHDQSKKSYSQQLTDTFSQVQKVKQDNEDYKQETNVMLQSYAKEIIGLKQKLMKQDAQLILNNSQQNIQKNTHIPLKQNSGNTSRPDSSNGRNLNKATSLAQLKVNTSFSQGQRPPSLRNLQQGGRTSKFEEKFGHLYNQGSIIEQNNKLMQGKNSINNSFSNRTPQIKSNNQNNKLLASLDNISSGGVKSMLDNSKGMLNNINSSQRKIQ